MASFVSPVLCQTPDLHSPNPYQHSQPAILFIQETIASGLKPTCTVLAAVTVGGFRYVSLAVFPSRHFFHGSYVQPFMRP